MQRSEARHSLPLHPQLISRDSATLPREQISSQIPFPTVLALAASELHETRFVPKRVARPFGFGLHAVVIASDNGIRTEDFHHHFPDLPLLRIPGVEAHEGEVFADAKSKAVSAVAVAKNGRRERPSEERKYLGMLRKANPFIGLDAMNAIPQLQKDGSVKFVRVGKPERETKGIEMLAIQQRFASLARLAKDNGWPSVPYIIEQANYVKSARRSDSKYDAFSLRQMVILLDPEKLAYLATPEGFAQYQQTALKSYPPLEKTAGGMKIEAFADLGLIQYMTHDPSELLSMQFDKTDQERAQKRSEVLAAGLFDRSLFTEYQSKFPPTLRQRWQRFRGKN